MKISDIFPDISEGAIADFCRKWKVAELSLFGSALKGRLRDDSDIDLLVSFEESADHTLFDFVRMEDELKDLFGREVDLVSRRGLESSMNYLRKEAIMGSAETIYGS